MAVPASVEERIRAKLRHFVPILTVQRDRDVSEADTITLVRALLADLFGFDKQREIVSDGRLHDSPCDLAIEIDGRTRLLLDVRPIGLPENERHVAPAAEFAASRGVDHIVLTNSIWWMLFRVAAGRPPRAELVVEFDLLIANPHTTPDVARIQRLMRESILREEAPPPASPVTPESVARVLTSNDAVLRVVQQELQAETGASLSTTALVDLLRTRVLREELPNGSRARRAPEAGGAAEAEA